jgi:uncharacterized protein YfkK (UPF0435 family)
MIIALNENELVLNDRRIKKKMKILTLSILDALPVLMESDDIANELYNLIKNILL